MKKNSIQLLRAHIFLGLIILSNACVGHNDRSATKGDEGEIPGLIADGQAHMLFDTLEHNFGTMIEGEKAMCYFSYRNTGTAELVLTSVESTCGCTSPDWSREPLAPGKSDVLNVVFDASGRSGAQRKKISVRSNGEPAEISLTIRADVIEN